MQCDERMRGKALLFGRQKVTKNRRGVSTPPGTPGDFSRGSKLPRRNGSPHRSTEEGRITGEGDGKQAITPCARHRARRGPGALAPFRPVAPGGFCILFPGKKYVPAAHSRNLSSFCAWRGTSAVAFHRAEPETDSCRQMNIRPRSSVVYARRSGCAREQPTRSGGS